MRKPRREAADTDVLILGGDISDSFNKSKYVKFDRHFSDIEEFRSVRGVLEFLAGKFKRVIVMRGNHDERLKKWLFGAICMNAGDIAAFNYLAQTAGANIGFDLADPISALVYGLPNVEMAPTITSGYASYDFFYQHGDLIVSHAERFSKVALKAADQSTRWFRDKAIPQGLCQSFRVLIQAHTHQAGKVLGDGNIWMFESGCLSAIPDYDAYPRLAGCLRPPALGYVVVHQNNGVTDINKSHFISLSE